MKLTFIQSGGFTGLVRETTVDTCDLPEEEARRLESLVRESGFLAASRTELSRANDARQYELVIEDGSVRRTLTFDDMTRPAEAAALIKELKARCRPERR